MKPFLSKILVLILTVNLMGAPFANAELPPLNVDPSVARPLPDDPLSRLFNLDFTTPQTWFYILAIAGIVYFQQGFMHSLNSARFVREDLSRKFLELNGTLEAKRTELAKIDGLLDDLESRVKDAQKALPKLDEHIKKLGFDGLKGFGALQQWLQSREGAKYLQKPEGKKWNSTYEELLETTTKAVEKPLVQIIRRANALYPDDNFSYIESAHDQPGKKPGDFVSVDDLRHKSSPINLPSIPGTLQSMRGRCDDYLAQLARDTAVKKKAASPYEFWIRNGYYKRPLVHAMITGGGLFGTYWLYRAMNLSKIQVEAKRRQRLTERAADDLAVQVGQPANRASLEPYYQIFEQVLLEHKQALFQTLDRNLTPDEKERIDLKKVVDDAMTPALLRGALERAVPFAAKKTLGDTTTLEALVNMLNASKTDSTRRELIFKPFAKVVYREVFNSLFAELSVGDPSENVGVGVLHSMLERTVDRVRGGGPTGTLSENLPAPRIQE